MPSSAPVTLPVARSFFAKVWHQVILYALKFGAVGLVGLAVDIGIFNALLLGLAGDGW